MLINFSLCFISMNDIFLYISCRQYYSDTIMLGFYLPHTNYEKIDITDDSRK